MAHVAMPLYRSLTIHMNQSNADNNKNGVFTPDQLADYLSISKATVYRLAGKRELPFKKVGGKLRFKRDAIEKYLASGPPCIGSL
jgi:excisionase family DNA binding protein